MVLVTLVESMEAQDPRLKQARDVAAQIMKLMTDKKDNKEDSGLSAV